MSLVKDILSISKVWVISFVRQNFDSTNISGIS